MFTNINDLRKEAYRMWGLRNKKVIFDYPILSNNVTSLFRFKFDFSDDKAAWPRTYAIAMDERSNPKVRIIAPIIMLKEYKSFTTNIKVWYDMPIEVHEQIVNITDKNPIIKRTLNKTKLLWNKIMPAKMHFNDVAPFEDYIYTLIKHNGDIVVQIS